MIQPLAFCEFCKRNLYEGMYAIYIEGDFYCGDGCWRELLEYREGKLTKDLELI